MQGKGSNKGAIPAVALIGIAVVVVVAVVAGYLMLSHNGSGGIASGNNGNGGSTSGGTTAGGSTGGSSVPSGNGNVYLSQAQFESLLGAGGTYSETGSANATELGQYLSTLNPSGNSSSSYLTNNVTAMWAASYAINTSAKKEAAVEMVAQSPVAQYIYAHMVANTTKSSNTSGFNYTVIRNATVDGMTYTYTSAQAFFTISGLIGYKNEYVVIYLDLGGTTPSGPLASAIASDLP